MNEAHIIGFSHVAVHVYDPEAAIKFYKEILGFTIMDDWVKESDNMRLIFMQKGSCVIEFVHLPHIKKGLIDGPINHIAMIVSDLEAIQQQLIEKGVEFETDFIRYDEGLFSNGARYLLFRGPNGERLQLVDDFMT